jgi:threonine synthase
LAAAVVARAANRTLRVFVPPSANTRVVDRLTQLGAQLEFCDRRASDPPGDPCYLRFLEAVAAGALPFACQGNQNGLTIEGGMTLGFELVAQHAAGGWPALDRIAIQVGGGAIASATVQSLRIARELGAIASLPAVHAVQTEAAHPVVDAWRRVVDDIERRLVADGLSLPAGRADGDRAQWVAANATPELVAEVLAHAQHHRSHYMVPIAHAPHSIASGILDDETYDWHQVVRGMLETGGWPVIVNEEQLSRARDTARRHTGINVSATGASGLAGLMSLAETGAIAATDRAAVLFTGVQR